MSKEAQVSPILPDLPKLVRSSTVHGAVNPFPEAKSAEHDPHTPSTLRSLQRADYLYPQAPSPVSVVQFPDGTESTAQRVPMRYEALDDVLDELPEFARETITAAWDKIKQ